MSRVGKLPVSIPNDVTVTVNGNTVLVKGQKGENQVVIQPGVTVTVKDQEVIVTRNSEIKAVKARHGAVRAHIANAIFGVTQGYKKILKLVGTGYRAAMQGQNLQLSLGFSHPIVITPVAGITFAVDNQDTIIVSGCNKDLVGQISANVRAYREPEPYKGKGIRYDNETIIRKAGKTSKGE